jgi:hypothetical protein
VVGVSSIVDRHPCNADNRYAPANPEGEDDQQPKPDSLVDGFLGSRSVGVGDLPVRPRLGWIPPAICGLPPTGAKRSVSAGRSRSHQWLRRCHRLLWRLLWRIPLPVGCQPPSWALR